MRSLFSLFVMAAGILAGATPSIANVITDWDARAVTFVTPRMPAPAAARAVAMVDLAMFDAVNGIEPAYKPYFPGDPAPAGASMDAAAASAATAVLASFDPAAANDLNAGLTAYLAAMPDGVAKSNGIAFGQKMGAMCLESRLKDGATAPDDYRPRTAPGVYVPTSPVVTPMYAKLVPFTLASAAQFRPAPPVSLTSAQWTADYNEIKDVGAKISTKRTPQQTENARFWLMTGPQTTQPVARQIALAKNLGIVASARLLALAAVAGADAYVAVMDAKYHYEFWRPVTAIRNGDTYGNPGTPRDATWLPLDATPMHPEYPCAHCIVSASVAAALEAVLGSANVPEFKITSVTVAGVTHQWNNLWDYSNEISLARIHAGFHYRFSTQVGQDMGRQIGQFAAQRIMQPTAPKPN